MTVTLGDVFSRRELRDIEAIIKEYAGTCQLHAKLLEYLSTEPLNSGLLRQEILPAYMAYMIEALLVRKVTP